ncbi:DNA polymerase I [Candidatus Uhrbacteria bacterium CG10_big_fil_rev_8_21_14_0_10_48_16]|uniref:DNA polymerase I n=1 Tax=Candidatus Uhrbacteria bacterium CG10_big_fil_rev_8_21_14_0_10_48_16 TaxID=1975038 RepID=A0A2M8LG42_9BACT|nr:MAG: DNA polymerase I [Candidatus Uhrbacteria bacterium CG10_big_fil_rev_8_21_14_0_10_48_16]
MKKQKTILLLDGNALLHRAWHAIPPLTTKDGLVVNAAYGFAMIVEKMIETQKPEFMAVAWDLPGKTFRHEIDENYKGHREKKEQELYDQIPLIQEILDTFGIPSLQAVGYEADDIIGTLSKDAGENGMRALIVTGDLDSLQLVDAHTQVLTFQKGISETKLYDIEAVKERYGLTPAQFLEYKALRGDPSDNIPGVAGIGEKTATLLLQRYETIQGIFEHLADIEEKYAKKIRGQEKQIELSLKLVRIVRDMKLEFDFDQAELKPPQYEKLLPLYRKLEFRTLLRKHGEQAGREAQVREKVEKAKVAVEVIKNREALDSVFVSGKTIGILIAEQPPDLFGATLSAVGLSNGKRTCVLPNPSVTDLAHIAQLLSQAKAVSGHDLKGLMHHLRAPIASPSFDVMIASYLLHSGSRAHDLSGAMHAWLGRSVPEVPEVFSKEKDYERFGQVVVALPELAKKMRSQMKESGVDKVFDEIEMPLVRILYNMEMEGIELDTASLETFSKQLKKRIDELTKKITTLAGVEFNLNSPSQLADVLFVTMELPTKGIKKTKTGYSTAAPELEKLWDTHEIIPLISEYRELTKLQSTYVEALPKLVAKDGRLHTSFNQTVAATGRLSSSDPNLQNIPIKTELGREIRKAFVAPRGKVLVAADYSQIELRLAAVIAKDQPFIKAFQEGADIHTRTASEVWDVAEDQVTKEQRRAAKAINFGVLYGMGPRALSKSTGLSMNEAKEFIARYFEIHKGIQTYLEETKVQAHDVGYVETLFGRRRYLPEIQSGVPMLVSMAERMAINMPVQGTAADIMKMAMLRIDGWLKKSGWPAKMILQVHDEVVLEVDKEAVDPVAKGIREMMESVAEFDVPLVVDVEVGTNWGEMN